MSDTESTRAEIDLRHQETEAGWQGVIDRFALSATPRWFEWLGWVLVLAAFEFVATKSDNPGVRVAVAASIALLWLYFNAFFFRFHFKGWPWITSVGVERSISLVLSGALATLCYLAARWIVGVVAATTGP
jgi:hypothetical protein